VARQGCRLDERPSKTILVREESRADVRLAAALNKALDGR
jgi:hypothetical protein